MRISKRWLRRSMAAALWMSMPGLASAAGPATLYGLYNTGVNNGQAVLKDNDQELHYTLIEPSQIVGTPVIATAAGGFPIPPWLDDNHLSAWIVPSNDTSGPGDFDGAPSYIYRTTFNLNNVDLSTLKINGGWASDNSGLDILLNGSSLGYTNTAQFGSFSPFILEGAFKTGLNTVDFVINNGGNENNSTGPTGLRVQFVGNGNTAPPPRPPHPNAIATLFPTGTDANGIALEGGAVKDTHYTIVAGPDGSALDALTVPNDGFPIGPWLANDANSRWISPPDVTGATDAMGDPGTYVYQTTFSMKGLDPNNAVIVAARGTDDGGPTVLLNGVEVPVTGSRGFGGKTWFAISSASATAAGASFGPGNNTLAFQVDNGGEAANPTGLRVDDLFARAAPLGTVPIPGIFATGVGDNKLPLEDGTDDPHYKLVSAPEGAEMNANALSGPPSPPWVDNTGSSRWIGPPNTPAGEGPPGTYEYELSFDLAGLDPASAVILGTWSADDVGGDIFLNGNATGNPQLGGFPSLSPFEISVAEGDTFLPGVNTLTFRVTNGGTSNNPTGLRVEGMLGFAKQGGLRGDFNGNGQLDAGDLDAMAGSTEPRFDVNGDGQTNSDDRRFWVVVLAKTWFGDANLNGLFNSGDFVGAFQAGLFETGVTAGWATGDWNGDKLFNSSDFVTAFQDGGYDAGNRQGVSAVPEPASLSLLLLGILPLLRARRS